METVFRQAFAITHSFGIPLMNRTTTAGYWSLGFRASRRFLEAPLCVNRSPQKIYSLFGITQGLGFGC